MTAESDQDPGAILDTLLTPEQIAERISASSGVNMSARTIWEKARRIGVSLKIGRTPLISAKDIPALLQEENRKWPPSSSEERSTTITPMRTVSSGSEALALLQKSRRKRKRLLKKDSGG